MSEPTVISLDNNNSIQILNQYIELAQEKGAFLLNEAELLKRATDVIMNSAEDKELNLVTSKQILIQGIHKGQRHGAWKLNDASLLHKVVTYVTNTLQQEVSGNPQQQVSPEEDLSELSQPVPLKPKEV